MVVVFVKDDCIASILGDFSAECCPRIGEWYYTACVISDEYTISFNGSSNFIKTNWFILPKVIQQRKITGNKIEILGPFFLSRNLSRLSLIQYIIALSWRIYRVTYSNDITQVYYSKSNILFCSFGFASPYVHNSRRVDKLYIYIYLIHN